MRDRWTSDQVAALAPDTSSMGAARGLANPGKWQALGASDGPPGTLWGLCKGSGSKPYQACVDVDEPAYRCSCPSRKFPCKHSLALLVMWSAGSVAAADAPAWVTEWHEARAGRAAKAQARREAAADGAPPTEAQAKAAAKRAAQRDDRVDRGVAELAQWLDDQVHGGIAGLDRAGYAHFDRVAARLVDAQAPGLAREVKALAGVASSGAGWDQRLLGEFGMLRLLATAHRRIAALPEPLAASVRAHVGYTVPVEAVLATPRLRDTWQVIGVRDEVADRLTTRRQWLLGRDSGRYALVLGFSVAGQPLPADLVVGTSIDAELCFYPGSAPMRAIVAHRHAPPERCAAPGPAVRVADVLDAYADALAADPWCDALPTALTATLVVPGVPGRDGAGASWRAVDPDGAALPLHPGAREPWTMVAAAGGVPATIAAEWSPAGLRPLAMYIDGEVIPA